MTDQKTAISKREAAARQLDQAIRLFFDGGDSLSVHTLAGATLQLCADIAKHEGHKSRLQQAVEERISPDSKKEWHAAVNRTRNFLKHADKDAEATHDYTDKETMFVLFEAVEIAAVVAPPKSRERLAYEMWFVFRFPYLLEASFASALQQAAKESGVDPSDRRMWLRWVREA